MASVSVEVAQARLPGLISALKPGEELLITQQGRTVARLTAESRETRRPRQPGSAVGMLTIVSDDDSHLDDFRAYMPPVKDQ